MSKFVVLCCYFLSKRIIFVLSIPLVSNKEYTLYHNKALPVLHNYNNPDLFSLVIPNTKYVGVTRDKTHYCEKDSLSKCTLVYNKYYICEVDNIYISDAHPTCVIELLN